MAINFAMRLQRFHKRSNDSVREAERAWRIGDARVAAALVSMGKRSTRDYLSRFPQARDGWEHLVDVGHLSARRFAQQFEPTRDELERWLDAGTVTSSECVQLLESRPTLLREVAGSRGLDVGVLCLRAPRHRKLEVASSLLRGDMAVPRAVVQANPQLDAMIWDMFQRGAVGFDTAAASAPRPPAAKARALMAAGALTPWEAHALGALGEDELAAAVAEGVWKAVDVVARGPVPDVLARRWIASGEVAYPAYMAGSLAAWRVDDPLPMAHVRLACSAEDMQTLVATMPLPRDRATRMAYAQRTVVAQMQGMDAYATVARGAGEACTVCFDFFSDDKPSFKLAACNHDASICIPCATTMVQTADAPTCHAEGCGAKVTPNDVAQLGVDPAKLAQKLLAARPPMVVEWFACPTPDCAGGRPMGQARTHQACRVCDIPSVYRGFDWVMELGQVQRLIRGVFSDRDGGGQVIRECYHCGVPTERNGGCPSMACTHCHQIWDFYEGRAHDHDYGRHGTQRYVPMAGTLLRIGLYGDLEPGATGIDNLPERVVAEAARLNIPVDVQANEWFLRRARGVLAITDH